MWDLPDIPSEESSTTVRTSMDIDSSEIFSSDRIDVDPQTVDISDFVVGTATRESDCADDEADFDDTLEEYDDDDEPVLEVEESDPIPYSYFYICNNGRLQYNFNTAYYTAVLS